MENAAFDEQNAFFVMFHNYCVAHDIIYFVIRHYANSEPDVFLNDFAAAYGKLINNGNLHNYKIDFIKKISSV